MPELPLRPSLDHLKRQAKDLLASARNGDATALERLQAIRPRREPPFALHDAQLTLAHEYGFPSWPRLNERVEWLNASADERAARFVSSACSDNPRPARETLQENSALARYNFHTALVTGQADMIAAVLDADPQRNNRPGGPLDRAPLLYVAHSRFFQDPELAPALLACARLLLERGADPNASHHDPTFGYPPQTAIYGAAGVNHSPELTRILLEAGADPNDNECLYHATETRDHTCLRLLMEHGINPNGTNALNRMLDFDDLDGARLLLEYGTDPNEYVPGALFHAILRGRSLETIELLITHGADVNARAMDGTSPYLLAVRHGREDIADGLLRHGAKDETTEADRFLGACMCADDGAAQAILAAHPGLLKSLTPHQAGMPADAADLGRVDALRVMLSMGMDPGVMPHGFAPLHFAGWKGDAEMVRLLVEAGAPLEQRNAYGGTALGSTIHGAIHREADDADYPAVVRCLVAAGAVIPREGFPDAPPEVQEALR